MKSIFHFSVLYLLACSLLLAPAVLIAMPVSGLYEAEVRVADQSDANRGQALRSALTEVLVKLTGDSAATSQPALAELVKQPDRYLLQYRYREREMPVAAGAATDVETTTTLWLQASFDANALDAALRYANVAAWGRERPSTLVWLAEADSAAQAVAGMEQSTDLLAPVLEQAKRRGLPLLLPLMDLQDAASLPARAIVAGDADKIAEASARYPADVVLAISVRAGETATAKWLAQFSDGSSASWNSRGDSRAAALTAGMDELAERLATRYAPRGQSAGGVEQITLLVEAVNSLQDYARTQTYLAGLSGVSRVEVSRVRNDRVTFLVEARSGREALRSAIRLGRMLDEHGGDADKLEYRLRP
ncbi:MAG: DUF2066 domain-containing protein [Gammaproteobacteria bacterium]